MTRHLTSRPFAALAITLLVLVDARAQEDSQGLTQIKEQELEVVRERISELKKSMDRRAAERDRISGDLQSAEVLISEKRIHLQELERQRRFCGMENAVLGGTR
jgi:hypothetical protein